MTTRLDIGKKPANECPKEENKAKNIQLIQIVFAVMDLIKLNKAKLSFALHN